MNSAEFLTAVMAKHGLATHYQVAKFLDIPHSTVSGYKHGRREFDDATAIKVAKALDEQPLYVIGSVQAERAKCTEVKAVWEYCAKIGKRATTVALLALAVFVAVDAPALQNAGVGVLCILCLIALRALWRTFRPDRHTHTKPRTPIGHPGRSQSAASGSRPRNRGYGLLAAGSLFVALSGCASSPSEIAWQTMHLVDVAQTISGPARDPRYIETGSAGILIGDTPSVEAVLVWGVAIGVIHYSVDRWLTNSGHADKKWVQILRAVDLGYKGFVIGSNHACGIRVFGDNKSPRCWAPGFGPGSIE